MSNPLVEFFQSVMRIKSPRRSIRPPFESQSVEEKKNSSYETGTVTTSMSRPIARLEVDLDPNHWQQLLIRFVSSAASSNRSDKPTRSEILSFASLVLPMIESDLERRTHSSHYQTKAILESLGLLHIAPTPSDFGYWNFFSSTLPIFESLPDGSLVKKVLVRSPTEFYQLTGMTINEFLIIYSELEGTLRRPISALKLGKKEVGSEETAVRTKLHPADALFAWLLNADGTSSIVIALLVGGEISRSTIDRGIERVTMAINIRYKEELELGSREERGHLYGFFSIHSKAIGVLDGTHCAIEVPTDEEDENLYYSGYKRTHTQNYLILINPFSLFCT